MRASSPSVARTAPGSAMWCSVATVTTASKLASGNGSSVPEPWTVRTPGARSAATASMPAEGSSPVTS
jgi:hypothetical protein